MCCLHGLRIAALYSTPLPRAQSLPPAKVKGQRAKVKRQKNCSLHTFTFYLCPFTFALLPYLDTAPRWYIMRPSACERRSWRCPKLRCRESSEIWRH